jgi:hypothetical protein
VWYADPDPGSDLQALLRTALIIFCRQTGRLISRNCALSRYPIQRPHYTSHNHDDRSNHRSDRVTLVEANIILRLVSYPMFPRTTNSSLFSHHPTRNISPHIERTRQLYCTAVIGTREADGRSRPGHCRSSLITGQTDLPDRDDQLGQDHVSDT